MAPSPDEIRQLAIDAGAKFPELVVAQFVLESDSGASPSGSFNYFGLKGKGAKKETTEYVNGKPVKIKDSFRNFASPKEAVYFLVSRWYKDWGKYEGVNRASTAEEAAKLLRSEGYATDPQYDKLLIKIMSEIKNPTEYVDLVDVATHFKGYAHQVAALKALQASLTKEQLSNLTRDWRSKDSPAGAQVAKVKFPINVPFFYQRDSKTGHGERMCFSSSMAMAMDYLNPEAIKGDDDWYLQQVFRFGDSVSSDAQLKAARSLGFSVEFRQNMRESDLLKQLDAGIPVPIGVLHKGPISSPTGGGHWVCLTGYTSTHFWVCDPFGEMDLINGGYIKTGPNDGNQVRYTRKNLMKRWLIHSKSDGWGMVFKK